MPEMARHTSGVISLLTDFGTADAYVGIMKGVILGINPHARIVDLCHEVSPQDVVSASYLLDSAHRFFPRGTLHVAVVDPGVGSDRRILALRSADHVFLAPDNGLLGFAIGQADEIVEVTNAELFRHPVSDTFHGRDIFAPVAARLSLGMALAELGPPAQEPMILDLPSPMFGECAVSGQVVYVDRFGNLVTNITRADCEKALGEDYASRATVAVADQEITGICRSYSETQPGSLLALFGSTDRLEISVSMGSAKELLKSGKGCPVTVSAS